MYLFFIASLKSKGKIPLQNNLLRQSYLVNTDQKTISTSREEIRRLKDKFDTQDEQNRKLRDKIQGLNAIISNNNSRINYLTTDLEKQKRAVGKYWIQIDTLKNELQARSFVFFRFRL